MALDACDDTYPEAQFTLSSGDGSALEAGDLIPYFWGGQGSAFSIINILLAGTGNAVTINLRLLEGHVGPDDQAPLLGQLALSSNDAASVLECAMGDGLNQGWAATLQLQIDDSIEPDELAGRPATLVASAEYLVEGEPTSVSQVITGTLELQ